MIQLASFSAFSFESSSISLNCDEPDGFSSNKSELDIFCNASDIPILPPPKSVSTFVCIMARICSISLRAAWKLVVP